MQILTFKNQTHVDVQQDNTLALKSIVSPFLPVIVFTSVFHISANRI